MTTLQRRRDAQPISRGWELFAAAIGGALIAVGLAALAALGLASALWGGGWVWPHGTEMVVHVLGGLLQGDPGRGLPPDQLRQVAGPVPVYVCVAAAELALVTTAVISAVLISRYRRPGDARGGMATRGEAQQALGLRQLRAGRAVIRPDRYQPQGRRARLHRLLSTGRGRTHRSLPSTDSGPTPSAPSTHGPRPPAHPTKEVPR